MDWTTLVQAEALASALDASHLVVLDCRHSLLDPLAGEAAYRRGNVPGAVHADMDRDLSGPHAPGAGRHPWPQADAFARTLGGWGVDAASQVVAYDDGDGAYAARFWALMRMLGHEKVAVLDGGWSRWTALGLPVETQVKRPITAKYAAEIDALYAS